MKKISFIKGRTWYLIPINNIDSSCFEKNNNKNNVSYYWKTYKKNIWVYCQNIYDNDNIEIFKLLKNNEIEIIKNNNIKKQKII